MALVYETTKVPLQTRMEMKSLVGKKNNTSELFNYSSFLIIRLFILFGALPVVRMHGIIEFVKLDGVVLGVGKGRWDGFAPSHGQFLAHYCHKASSHCMSVA